MWAMAAVTIRSARPDDAAAVAAIYNDGIAGRQATFETRPRAPAEILAWVHRELPFLVAQDGDGRVVGFARVTPYSERPFYAGVGEHTVYVDAAARGEGLGRRLLDELAAESERRGLYKPNDPRAAAARPAVAGAAPRVAVMAGR